MSTLTCATRPHTVARPITREHWIEMYGGGSYKRGIEWLREKGLYVVRCNGCAGGCFGWKAEVKG